AAEWRGFYILCVNSRCYILDSMQRRSFNAKSGGSYVYECFYWTNVPAAALCEADGTLYFGTEDGRLCRFNTDLDDTSRYSDDGEGIEAIWSTKSDDDGDFGRTKSVNRRACAGTILAHRQGGVPSMTITLPALAPRPLGALLYCFEKACGVSGYLLGVNPFDQPGVEQYKTNMFALMHKPGFETESAAVLAAVQERQGKHVVTF
ncbi:MAG TPA: hypothetical protein PK794_09065, partial [Armatimonadota bacterium]|nr:hypothetical protein [Armatimonadota bacterium]